MSVIDKAHVARFGPKYHPFNNDKLIENRKPFAILIPTRVLIDGANASLLQFENTPLGDRFCKAFYLWWWLREQVLEGQQTESADSIVITTVERIPHNNSEDQVAAYRWVHYIDPDKLIHTNLDVRLIELIKQNRAASQSMPSANQIHAMEFNGDSMPTSSSSSRPNNNPNPAAPPPQNGPDGAPVAAAAAKKKPQRGNRNFALRRPYENIFTEDEYKAIASIKNFLNYTNRDMTQPELRPQEVFAMRHAMYCAHGDKTRQVLFSYREETTDALGNVTYRNKIPFSKNTYRLREETLLWKNIDGMMLSVFTSKPRVEDDSNLAAFDEIYQYDQVDRKEFAKTYSKEEAELMKEDQLTGSNSIFESAIGFRAVSSTRGTVAQIREDMTNKHKELSEEFAKKKLKQDYNPSECLKEMHEKWSTVQKEAISDLLNRCWNTHCSENSRAMKGVIKYVENYLTRTGGVAHFVIDKLSTNLSYWEDFQVRFMIHLETAFRAISCHESTKLGLWSHLGSSDPIRTQKLNILRVGAPGIYKSYILEILAIFAIPDTFDFKTYESAKAELSSGSEDCKTEACHEGSPERLGVTNSTRSNGPNNSSAAGFATSEPAVIFRNTLDSGVMRLKWLELKPNRHTVYATKDYNVGHQINVNFGEGEIDQAILDRFYVSHEYVVTRKDRDNLSLTSMDESDTLRDFKDIVVDEMRWVQSLVMIAHTLIWAGILKPVNTKVATIMYAKILKEARNRGFPCTDKMRHNKRLIAAVRVNTVVEAVLKLFFSENSSIKTHKYDTNGVKGIMMDMLRLQPLLVCQNIGMIVHVLGSMQNMYASRVCNEVWKALRSLLSNEVPHRLEEMKQAPVEGDKKSKAGTKRKTRSTDIKKNNTVRRDSMDVDLNPPKNALSDNVEDWMEKLRIDMEGDAPEAAADEKEEANFVIEDVTKNPEEEEVIEPSAAELENKADAVSELSPMVSPLKMPLHIPTHDGSFASVYQDVTSNLRATHIDELLDVAPNYKEQYENLLNEERARRQTEADAIQAERDRWEEKLAPCSKNTYQGLSSSAEQNPMYVLKLRMKRNLYTDDNKSLLYLAKLVYSKMDPACLPRLCDVIYVLENLCKQKDTRKFKSRVYNGFEDNADEEELNDMDAFDYDGNNLIQFHDEYVFLSQYAILNCTGNEFMYAVRAALEHKNTKPRTVLWCVNNFSSKPYEISTFTMIPNDAVEFVTENADYATSGIRSSILGTLLRIPGKIIPDLDREFSGSAKVRQEFAPELVEFWSNTVQCWIPRDKISEWKMGDHNLMNDDLILNQHIKWEEYRIQCAKRAAKILPTLSASELKVLHAPNFMMRYPAVIDELTRSTETEEVARTKEQSRKQQSNRDKVEQLREFVPDIAEDMWQSPLKAAIVFEKKRPAETETIAMSESDTIENGVEESVRVVEEVAVAEEDNSWMPE